MPIRCTGTCTPLVAHTTLGGLRSLWVIRYAHPAAQDTTLKGKGQLGASRSRVKRVRRGRRQATLRAKCAQLLAHAGPVSMPPAVRDRILCATVRLHLALGVHLSQGLEKPRAHHAPLNLPAQQPASNNRATQRRTQYAKSRAQRAQRGPRRATLRVKRAQLTPYAPVGSRPPAPRR